MISIIKSLSISTIKKILLLCALVYIAIAIIVSFEIKEMNIPYPLIIVGSLMGMIFFLYSITDTKSENLEDITPYSFNFIKFVKVIFITHIIGIVITYFYPDIKLYTLVIHNLDIENYHTLLIMLTNLLEHILNNMNYIPIFQILIVIFLSFIFIKNSIFWILELILHEFIYSF